MHFCTKVAGWISFRTKYFSFKVAICSVVQNLCLFGQGPTMFCIYRNLKLSFTYTEKDKTPQLLPLEFSNILLHVCYNYTLYHRRQAKNDTNCNLSKTNFLGVQTLWLFNPYNSELQSASCFVSTSEQSSESYSDPNFYINVFYKSERAA